MNRLPVAVVARRAGLVRSRRRVRGGVSLLEVLFSIGVAMIGLVGIASLLPLAGALARRGAVVDAAASVGANSVRQFSARGMAKPDNWRWYNGTAFTTVTLPGTDIPQPGMSFCLDPYLIGQIDPTDATYGNEMALRNRFPLNVNYPAALPYFMPRITLASSLPTGVLAPTVATELFVSSDSLVFDLPGDRTIGPIQSFSFQSARAGHSTKTQLARTHIVDGYDRPEAGSSWQQRKSNAEKPDRRVYVVDHCL